MFIVDLLIVVGMLVVDLLMLAMVLVLSRSLFDTVNELIGVNVIEEVAMVVLVAGDSVVAADKLMLVILAEAEVEVLSVSDKVTVSDSGVEVDIEVDVKLERREEPLDMVAIESVTPLKLETLVALELLLVALSLRTALEVLLLVEVMAEEASMILDNVEPSE